MISKWNEHARDPEYASFTTDWLSRKAPIVYLYGPTGEGKTYAIGKLIEHQLTDDSRPYAPVLYIDGDEGCETVGEFAESSELCELRPCDVRYDEKLNWFFSELARAEKVECGAIVIEGLNALFKSMLTPAIRSLSAAKGADLWTAHNEPAQRMDTVFEAIKELAINRRVAGRGVPIVASLNVREVVEDPEAKQSPKMFVPNFSPNRTRAAMATSDAFIELQRGPSGSKMLCRRDGAHKFRKLRRDAVAVQVESAWDLSLPGLFTLWAFTAAKAKHKLDKKLQAAPPSAPEDEPKTSSP